MKHLKSIVAIVTLSIFILFNESCTKKPDLSAVIPSVTFDYTANSVTFTIPPVHTKGTASIAAVGFKTQLDSIKKANNITALDVKTLYIKQAQLTIISPSGMTFDAIDSMSLYISANGIAEQKFASIGPIPKGGADITIPVNSKVNLASYFKQNQVNIRATASTNDTIPNSTTFTLTSKYTVSAN